MALGQRDAHIEALGGSQVLGHLVRIITGGLNLHTNTGTDETCSSRGKNGGK